MADQAADILTLNYDLLLERATIHIHRASVFSDLYVAPLTERMPPGTGIFISRSPTPDPHAALYKLHGSTNWYTAGWDDHAQSGAYVVRDGGLWSPDELPFVPQRHYADLQPMVIAPAANKSPQYGAEVLRSVWTRAAQALQTASELVVIGYSFPVTDAAITAMLHSELAADATVTLVDVSQPIVDRATALLDNSRPIQRYVGPSAVADFVADRSPHLIEWGVSMDGSGIETPHLIIDGNPVAPTTLPALESLDGPDNWDVEHRFARWVGQQWPGTTATAFASAQFRSPGGVGFSPYTKGQDIA